MLNKLAIVNAVIQGKPATAKRLIKAELDNNMKVRMRSIHSETAKNLFKEQMEIDDDEKEDDSLSITHSEVAERLMLLLPASVPGEQAEMRENGNIFETTVRNQLEALDYEKRIQEDDLLSQWVEDVETFEPVEQLNQSQTITMLVFLTNDLADFSEFDEPESVEEIQRVTKVNFKGKKRIKIKCGRGFKLSGNHCKKIAGGEALTIKRAQRKRLLTKKSQGVGAKLRQVRKTKIAKRKRKQFGLKT